MNLQPLRREDIDEAMRNRNSLTTLLRAQGYLTTSAAVRCESGHEIGPPLRLSLISAIMHSLRSTN